MSANTDRALTEIAMAIQQHAAVNVAMSITPEGSSTADMLATADQIMDWMQTYSVHPGPVTYSPPGWESG